MADGQRVARQERDEADRLRAALSAMTAERDAALARVRELEAPPVVPRGWVVRMEPRSGWVAEHPPSGVAPVRLPQVAPAGVYRALIWAIEHWTLPPHEADEEVERG